MSDTRSVEEGYKEIEKWAGDNIDVNGHSSNSDNSIVTLFVEGNRDDMETLKNRLDNFPNKYQMLKTESGLDDISYYKILMPEDRFNKILTKGDDAIRNEENTSIAQGATQNQQFSNVSSNMYGAKITKDSNPELDSLLKNMPDINMSYKDMLLADCLQDNLGCTPEVIGNAKESSKSNSPIPAR